MDRGRQTFGAPVHHDFSLTFRLRYPHLEHVIWYKTHHRLCLPFLSKQVGWIRPYCSEHHVESTENFSTISTITIPQLLVTQTRTIPHVSNRCNIRYLLKSPYLWCVNLRKFSTIRCLEVTRPTVAAMAYSPEPASLTSSHFSESRNQNRCRHDLVHVSVQKTMRFETCKSVSWLQYCKTVGDSIL